MLDVSLLWELDCAFCQENAASNAVNCVPLQERKKFGALQLMFADLPNNTRQTLRLPVHYPTNPQAEVLVFDSIPVKYIQAVHLEHNLEELITSLKKVNPFIKLFHDKRYFFPRYDYIFWRSQRFDDFTIIDNSDINILF